MRRQPRIADQCDGSACRRRGGFTLLEVVLAIGLASVVIYLLTTAIEVYLVRVDTSRTRVESAQLARTLLDKIASDLAAGRYVAAAAVSNQPAGATPGSDSAAPGSASTGGTNPSPPTSDAGSDSGVATGGGAAFGDRSRVGGLIGTAAELKISSVRASRFVLPAVDDEPSEDADADDLPEAVRYYFAEGERFTGEQFARRADLLNTPEGVAGLYRQRAPAVAIGATAAADAEPSAAVSWESDAELLAPEVLELGFRYFDGTEFVESWNAGEKNRLPVGIEVRLRIVEPHRGGENERQRGDQDVLTSQNIVEHFRFVRLPDVRAPNPAQMLAQVAGAAGGSGGETSGAISGGPPGAATGSEDGP